MRISDWSSDVCSSDLSVAKSKSKRGIMIHPALKSSPIRLIFSFASSTVCCAAPANVDRQSVVSGTSVSVCVDLGGRHIIKKRKSAITIQRCTEYETRNNNTETRYVSKTKGQEK